MGDIYATSLKGYCSLQLCWRFLQDVSAQLVSIHESGQTHGSVDLQHIAIEGRQFILSESEATDNASSESDVWSLAASAFELMLGSPILNGAGESSQNGRTPLPALPQAGAEPLNLLLHRCLNHNTAERPTAAEVFATAQKVVEREMQPTRPPRIQVAARKQETLEKADRQWPERMLAGVTKQVTLLLVLLLVAVCSFAQVSLNATDEQVTKKLLNAVLLLRKGDARNWNMAHDELEKRVSQFTLMDELEDEIHDCPLVSGQMKTFGVNRMVTELKRGSRVQNTGRELLDGADTRFNYSLFEKGIKKGATATYTMSGRYGRQVFLIVPYYTKQPYSVELAIRNRTVIPITGKDENGITYYIVDTGSGPVGGDTIILKITNDDKNNNASFVIINHNYRNKK